MPQTDIVAELDRWLDTEANDPEWAAWHGEYAVMRRARDEIVALRKVTGWPEPLDILSAIHRERAEAKAEQRERDAKIAEAGERIYDGGVAVMIAAAIRNQGPPDAA